MEIKKVSERFEEKCSEKYDSYQLSEHWLEVDKIIKDCNNSIMEMGLPDIGYTSQVDQIHEYCDELMHLNSYIRSAYGSVYEWLDYPLWLDFKNGVTEAISQIKAEEITTKNIVGIGGYYDIPLSKEYEWGTMPKKELTLSDFMNLMPEGAEKNGFKVQGLHGMKEFQELFQEEYEAKKKELPDLEDPRRYFKDRLIKGQEEHSDYHPFLDLFQTALDVVGFFPGVGEPADLVNAILYGLRGDKVNATLSAAAGIPVTGTFATGGKVALKVEKTTKVVKKVVVKKVGKNAMKVWDEVVAAIKKIKGGTKSIFNKGRVTISDLKANPKAFRGKSANEIADMLRKEGYDVTIKNSTKSRSGAQIIQLNNPGGGKNISQVQVSPGGGRHGASPYVKISTTDQGIIKIIDGAEALYKSDGLETATLIFTGGGK